MPKQVVCDGTEFIDNGKYVIIRHSKGSLAKVKFAKRLELRYFIHKGERYYIAKR